MKAKAGPLYFEGAFRLYFNRHTDAPRVWTIAAIDRAWEINVALIVSYVTLTSRYAPTEHKPDHSGPPAAWFEGIGVVSVDAGRAFITAAANK